MDGPVLSLPRISGPCRTPFRWRKTIQSPLAIVNKKNRARSVHYSKLFSIAKMTKEVLVVRGTSKKKMVRVSGATASIIETAGFKQSYVTHKS